MVYAAIYLMAVVLSFVGAYKFIIKNHNPKSREKRVYSIAVFLTGSLFIFSLYLLGELFDAYKLTTYTLWANTHYIECEMRFFAGNVDWEKYKKCIYYMYKANSDYLKKIRKNLAADVAAQNNEETKISMTAPESLMLYIDTIWANKK